MALSDVVVVMNAGRIEQAGPPDVVYRRPATRFVADFIGRANFLAGDVTKVDDGTVDISMMGVAMRIPSGGGHRPGDTAVVVARPESIRVGEGELRAKVKGSTFLGSYVEYELELVDGQENMLAVDGEWMSHGIHSPGEDIAWTLVPERAYALPANPLEAPPANDVTAGPEGHGDTHPA
jgi:iron(III) transport system ATP-binding protein